MNPTNGESGPARALRRALGGLCLLAFLGAISQILHDAFTRPLLSWDMMDYMALALEWTEDDPAVVHQRTYEIAKAELTPETYEDWVAGSNYRKEVAADWKLFDANLGFHRGRYLYTFAISVLHRLGVPLTKATWWPNVFFWGCTAVLVFAWARRHYSMAAAAILSLGILYSPPVLSIVPSSTPDAMAMFLVGLGLYFLVERRAYHAGAATVSLAMLARTDFFLVAFGIAAGLFLFVDRSARPGNRFLVLWLAVTTVIYTCVSICARDPGWWAVFVTPFQRYSDLSKVPAFKASSYVRVLRMRIAELHYIGYDRAPDGSWVRGSTFVIVYLVGAAMGIVLAARTRLRELGIYQAVLLGLILAALARFLLYPYLWDRYFVSLWVPVPLCLGSMFAILATRFRERTATDS